MSTRPASLPPAFRDAGTLAAEIRARRISAAEALRAHLDRVAAHASLNAVVTLNPEAVRLAEAADRALARGEIVGKLHGVPFTVKDTIDTAGLRTTAGSATLSSRVPRHTATVVRRLQDAGAILLGKTNCSEFAVDTHTANPLFGDTWNPRDPSRTPGGSSGGEAAAVATGLSAFGVGTDFGGSIRWPAHCTGVFGLRPSVGLVPGTGTLPCFPGNAQGVPNSALLLHRLMTTGPLARSAADLALLLSVMAGPDGLDPGAVPVPLQDPGAVDPERLAIAWCDGEGTTPVAAEIRRVVRDAATALAVHVGRVEESRPDGLDEAASLFVESRDAEGMPEVAALVAGREDRLGGFMRDYLAGDGPARPFAVICELAGRRDALRARVLHHFRTWPVLLLPVASVAAPDPAQRSVAVDGTPVAWSRIGSCCRAISLLGLPAASVPFGSGGDGLPIGVQVVGRPFLDHEVLAVAALLERSAPVAAGGTGTAVSAPGAA